MKSSQNAILLDRLSLGPITALAALSELRTMRLAARVKDLRNQGHAINSRLISVGGKRVAEYSMEACA